ncbi:hypothetical protein NFI96_003216 [Prochilodus magdalenae]|nr:hypothetical protein NFI96_003216 [Prochilodus magdalenae]
MFYRTVVSSCLFYAVVCWGGSIKKRDGICLDKLVRNGHRQDLNGNDCRKEMSEIVLGMFVIKHEGADPTDGPEDIGIVVEGVEVLS